MAGTDCDVAGRRTDAWRAPDRGRPRRDVSRVGRRRGQAATGGSRERRSAARRRSMDAGAVTTARTVVRPAHPVHRVTSTSKVRRKRVAQSSARKRRVERAAKESVPVRDGEDVRGYRKRRPRHEERRRRHRRWHSRSGRDEPRLTRPILRARPQPRPPDARDDGGSKLRSRLCHGARALLLGRRRGASCLRLGRARHHARSPWVARREHPVQPKKGVARRRNHRRQTRETLYRRHHALRDAPAPGVLHAVRHEAIATDDGRMVAGGARSFSIP